MAKVEPQSPQWVPTAPVQIVESRRIAATPSTVWRALIDNETWSEWSPGFRSSSFITPAPHGVGSVRTLHQDQFKVEERITTWKPEKEWGMTVVGINIPVVKAMAENVELADEGDSTDVSWHIGVQTNWWARPLRPILVANSRKNLRKALEQLDARVSGN